MIRDIRELAFTSVLRQSTASEEYRGLQGSLVRGREQEIRPRHLITPIVRKEQVDGKCTGVVP
ncbi:MAG: hypothetical protein U1D30_23290 [Planctomycetota bacterium]